MIGKLVFLVTLWTCYVSSHADADAKQSYYYTTNSHASTASNSHASSASNSHASTASGSCPRNELLYECKPCAKTCALRNDNVACRMSCQPGCDCAPGYYRNDNGHCVAPEKCEGDCGKNETYTSCGTACPKTCDNIHERDTFCTANCVQGCFCNSGLVRNKDGQCVEPGQCPNVCGKHQSYKTCGSLCPTTCNNYNQTGRVCAAVCVEGCFCDEGYILNSNGRCVLPEKCTSKCGKNQSYSTCGTACQKTCDNYDEEIACTDQCVKGCFCNDGYVLNANGDCVLEEDCSITTCGKNQHYTTCGTACPLTCDNYQQSDLICTEQCVQGCFCNDGYVLNANGTCVLPQTCPANQCPLNEVYYVCGTACPLTCSNPKLGPCPFICVPGCYCKPGYYRDNDGSCVLLEQCSTNTCGKNQHYTDCGTACPLTCDNYQQSDLICTDQCIQGCFCNDGYVLSSNGTCVLPQSCPVNECPVDELYNSCGSACPLTCENPNPRLCTLQCVPGCYCQSGYYRDNNGSCVLLEQCTNQCPLGEVWNSCGSACPLTCEYPDPRPCTKQCVPGCYCQTGYYRDSDGSCVLLDQCSTSNSTEIECSVNEVPNKCKYSCPPETCDIVFTTYFCAENQTCKPGCDCISGYLRDPSTLLCIPSDQCRQTTNSTEVVCGANEVPNSCKYSCPPDTCKILFTKYRCIENQTCAPGCDCISGYLRDPSTKLCIPAEKCFNPTTQVCPVHEEYQTCGTACPPTCSDPNPQFCTLQCVSGCFCVSGYVRNDQGVCVPPEQCPSSCPCNEYLETNTSICALDSCATRKRDFECPHNCRNSYVSPRCICVDSYLRNDHGICVPEERCPRNPKCGPNEYFTKCKVPDCPGQNCSTLYIKANCLSVPCEPGCDCIDGYLRNEQGICIPTEACPPLPPVCPEHETWKECGTACPATCMNPNPDCCGKRGFGCYCDEGYYRNKLDKCVPMDQCGCHGDPNAVEGGCGYHCNNTCYSLIQPETSCPKVSCKTKGCDCAKGFVFDENIQLCVKPDQCSEVCEEDETYDPCIAGNCRPKTCRQYLGIDSVSCPRLAFPNLCAGGCICSEGTVRNDKGDCVPYDQCQAPITCPANEKYISCLDGFCGAQTCAQYLGEPVACAGLAEGSFCAGGCICQDGYKRDGNGTCIIEEQCACNGDPNAQYGYSGNCGKNCRDYGREVDCPEYSDLKCECKDGYYFNDITGKCVGLYDCPCNDDPNAEYGCSTCGRLCGDYAKQIQCPLVKCDSTKLKCVCRDGFYYNNVTLKCGTNAQCSNSTGCNGDPNASSGCGTNCGKRCSELNNTVSGCPLYCKQNGCDCNAGYYLNENTGKCVPKSECPSTDGCNGDPNAQLGCSFNCGKLCGDYGKASSCPANTDFGNSTDCENPQCNCKDGYYLNNATGLCVTNDECPGCGGDPNAELGCSHNCGRMCGGSNNTRLCPREVCTTNLTCQCMDGYFYNNVTKTCVTQDNCPTPSIGCNGDPNAKSGCGTNCGSKCSDLNSSVSACPLYCLKNGCDCKPGYYLNENTGKCVTKKQCPTNTAVCNNDPNAELGCTSNCGRNCGDYGKVFSCPAQPTNCTHPKCECKAGYYLNNVTGLCVTNDQCPTSYGCRGDPNAELGCTFNCGRKCGQNTSVISCPSHRCLTDIVTCDCKEGYFYNNVTGFCVTSDKCPATSTGCNGDPNATSGCGNYCGTKCSDVGSSGGTVCSFACRVDGCDCKTGYYLNPDTGKCVLPSKCPSKTICKGDPNAQLGCTNNCGKHCGDDGKIFHCPLQVANCTNPKCECKDGYYLNNVTRLCVTNDQCPTTSTCNGDPNAQLGCTNNCGKHCGDNGKTFYCPLEVANCTNPACECKDGYYLNNATGLCVTNDQCPATTTGCGEDPNAELGCSNNCGRMCGQNGSTIFCPREVCTKNLTCQCKNGYFYNNITKLCVTRDECPAPSTGCKGDPNASKGCGSNCGKRCSDLGQESTFCSYVCALDGCDCNAGYYYDSDKQKCVTKSECPCNGDPNAIFMDCANGCQSTCARPNLNEVCKSACVPNSCQCRDGFLLDQSTGKCVKQRNCSCNGDPNAELNGCGDHCNKLCSDYGRKKKRICPVIECFTQGCECKDGYFYDQNDKKCVKPSQCSANQPNEDEEE